MPRTLVSMATEARSRAAEEEAEIDEFWCVFDVEWPRNHPGLREAIEQARAEQHPSRDIQPMLRVVADPALPGPRTWLDNNAGTTFRRQLDGSTDKGLDAAKYMPLFADAARRAAGLDERHRQNGTALPDDNPSSGMHRLIAAVEPPDT